MNLEREPMEVPVVGGAKPKPTASSASGSKKRSPKSPRKSRPNPEMQSSQDTVPPEKPREKRHHKEKRSHRGKQQQPEQDPNAPSGGAASAGNGSKSKMGDKPPRTRVRQGSQRQSIRRQSQVEHPHDQQQHGGRDHRDQRGGDVSVSGRKSKIPEEMSGAGGGVISGAELSDVFDEESQHQYYPEDSDIKYMEDRSNCRKK